MSTRYSDRDVDALVQAVEALIEHWDEDEREGRAAQVMRLVPVNTALQRFKVKPRVQAPPTEVRGDYDGQYVGNEKLVTGNGSLLHIWDGVDNIYPGPLCRVSLKSSHFAGYIGHSLRKVCSKCRAIYKEVNA